jgi:hypothetical protein
VRRSRGDVRLDRGLLLELRLSEWAVPSLAAPGRRVQLHRWLGLFERRVRRSEMLRRIRRKLHRELRFLLLRAPRLPRANQHVRKLPVAWRYVHLSHRVLCGWLHKSQVLPQ